MAKKRLRMRNSTELKRTVNKIANLLLNGEIDPKTGNALLYACNVAAGIVRIDEQQKKLDELEKTIRELEAHERY